MKYFYYRVYGVRICSEIELPELQPHTNREADVRILNGSVPEHLDRKTGSGVLYEVSGDDFIFKLDTVGKFRVQRGTLITVEPNKGVDPGEVRLFLLGSTFGALLHQRGMVALHGSAVSRNNSGLVITGASAAGKSTLAAGFKKAGYSIIADDISVLGKTDSKNYFIYQGIPHLKLWKDVLNHLNSNEDLEKVRPSLEKYKKPVSFSDPDETNRLKKVICLQAKNTPGFRFMEITGAEKFNLLWKNTYRIQFVNKMNKTLTHFTNLSEVANTIQVFQVERPAFPLQVMDLVDYISENILGE